MCVTRVHIQADDFAQQSSYCSPTLIFCLPPPPAPPPPPLFPLNGSQWWRGASGSEAAPGLKGTFQPGQTHSGLAAWLRNMGHRLTLGGPCQSQPSGAFATYLEMNEQSRCSAASCNKRSASAGRSLIY